MQAEKPNAEAAHYGDAWFRARAFDSLKKIDDGVWDYSDSLLLYRTEAGEEEYESIQEEGNAYAELVTKPEMKYLEEIAAELVSELPDTFEYIDLGPGTAHKEQFIFNEAKKQNKQFIYTPVDISPRYLGLAQQYAAGQGITVTPTRSSFEELPTTVKKSDTPRFVSIGLTFSNYAPEEILRLLKNIAGESGTAFIDVQMRDRVDMEEVQKVYTHEVAGVFDPKLELLGLRSEDISERTVDDGVSVWYTLRKSNPQLEEKGIRAGDKILIFQSLRYTKDWLEKAVTSVFPSHRTFDHGGPFVGTLLKAS